MQTFKKCAGCLNEEIFLLCHVCSLLYSVFVFWHCGVDLAWDVQYSIGALSFSSENELWSVSLLVFA